MIWPCINLEKGLRITKVCGMVCFAKKYVIFILYGSTMSRRKLWKHSVPQFFSQMYIYSPHSERGLCTRGPRFSAHVFVVFQYGGQMKNYKIHRFAVWLCLILCFSTRYPFAVDTIWVVWPLHQHLRVS